MPFLQGPKCIFAPYLYNPQPNLTVLIESSFVSSSDPLLLELLRCSLSAIDGSRDPLCSGSSYIRCSSSFLLDAPLSTSAPVLRAQVCRCLTSLRKTSDVWIKTVLLKVHSICTSLAIVTRLYAAIATFWWWTPSRWVIWQVETRVPFVTSVVRITCFVAKCA